MPGDAFDLHSLILSFRAETKGAWPGWDLQGSPRAHTRPLRPGAVATVDREAVARLAYERKGERLDRERRDCSLKPVDDRAGGEEGEQAKCLSARVLEAVLRESRHHDDRTHRDRAPAPLRRSQSPSPGGRRPSP